MRNRMGYVMPLENKDGEPIPRRVDEGRAERIKTIKSAVFDIIRQVEQLNQRRVTLLKELEELEKI